MEVTEFLGRAKSALRSDSDSDTGLSERIRQSPEAYAEFGNDTAEAAASPRYRGAVREPAAAAVRQQDQDKLAGMDAPASTSLTQTDLGQAGQESFFTQSERAALSTDSGPVARYESSRIKVDGTMVGWWKGVMAHWHTGIRGPLPGSAKPTMRPGTWNPNWGFWPTTAFARTLFSPT